MERIEFSVFSASAHTFRQQRFEGLKADMDFLGSLLQISAWISTHCLFRHSDGNSMQSSDSFLLSLVMHACNPNRIVSLDSQLSSHWCLWDEFLRQLIGKTHTSLRCHWSSRPILASQTVKVLQNWWKILTITWWLHWNQHEDKYFSESVEDFWEVVSHIM